MQLAPADRGKLVQTVADSFTSFDIDLMLQSRFGLAYRNIAADTLPDVNRALQLFNHFQMRNEIEQLVAALRDARPKVSAIIELAERVGLITSPDMQALQAIVRPGQGGLIGHNPVQFRTDLAAREDTICRIVVHGTRYGTGTLVGPDLVLTNQHVIGRAARDDGTLADPVICEFDYRLTVSGYATPVTPVSAAAVVASSGYAPEDLTGEAENHSIALLDYSLLRLVSDTAARPIVDGGLPRGFTRIVAAPVAPIEDQGILVLQHPDAQPLRLDLGAINWRGATRIRHTANTLAGSSGAPVFDGDLAFAALHHAGYDWPRAAHPVNQAIPMSLIAADIRARGIQV